MNNEEHSSFFIINSSLNKMDTIELQQTLPEVFAGRDGIVSDVWHRQVAFQKGKMYLIEAASGTGKSSLCSFIYGYRTDYQGIITFDGENVRKLTVKQWTDIRKRSLGMLFQELRLFGELTAWENVQLKNGLTGFCRKQQVKDWFEQLGIADKWDVRPPSSVFGTLERVVRMGLLTREKAGKYAVLRPGPNLARWASVQPVARGAQMAMGGDALPDRARGPVPVGALEIRLTLHVHGAGTPFARVEIAGVEP